jgi:ABC-type multidrug transport system fused ATPase/permease subunit
MLKSDSKVKGIAMALGMTLMQIITTFVMVYQGMVTDGIISWSDLQVDDIFKPLATAQGLAAAGSIAALTYIRSRVTPSVSKAAELVGLLASGAAGIALAAAYIGYFSIVRRHAFP